MQRGEVWTLLDSGYASKPRPIVIMQGTAGDAYDSVVACLLTSHPIDDDMLRPLIKPTHLNGLEKTSYAMTEKLLAVAQTKLGQRIRRLEDTDMTAIRVAIKRLLEI